MWAKVNRTGHANDLYFRPEEYLPPPRSAGPPGALLMCRLLKPAKLFLVAAFVPFAVSTPAPAQEVGLSPTLVSIKSTHTVRLGYREASPPFSYLDQANRPIGYSRSNSVPVVPSLPWCA